jgi:hypothetical protein
MYMILFIVIFIILFICSLIYIIMYDSDIIYYFLMIMTLLSGIPMTWFIANYLILEHRLNLPHNK